MSPACTEFVAGGGRKGNRCTTCRQKQRHHPTPSGNPHHVSDPKPIQRHAASCPPPSENTLVQDILDKYTRSRSQPSRTTTSQLKLVRREAIAGLRKMPPRAAKSKTPAGGLTPGPVNTVGTRTTASSSCTERRVKIGMLFMTPHGLGEDGELTDSRKLGKAELEEFRDYGMLISEHDEQPIEFLTSWTATDIDLWLRRLLPKPFQWLDARLGQPDEGSFHWILLSSERKRYFRLRRATITGKELDEVKGTTGRKFSSFSIVIAPHIVIPKPVYTNWDRAIARALTRSHGSADQDLDTASSDMDLDKADISTKLSSTKGKAPARSVMEVLELSSTDSGSDESETTVAIEQSSLAPQPLGVFSGATVAPNQSAKLTVPRATVHTPVVLPDSGSDDDFFFTNLIARESVADTTTTGSKRPRRVSLSELASVSEPHPSGSGSKRIKSESHPVEAFRFNDAQVTEAGPSGSGTQAARMGRRSTAVRIPGGPSRNPWN